MIHMQMGMVVPAKTLCLILSPQLAEEVVVVMELLPEMEVVVVVLQENVVIEVLEVRDITEEMVGVGMAEEVEVWGKREHSVPLPETEGQDYLILIQALQSFMLEAAVVVMIARQLRWLKAGSLMAVMVVVVMVRRRMELLKLGLLTLEEEVVVVPALEPLIQKQGAKVVKE
jgi:hypothetical protein